MSEIEFLKYIIEWIVEFKEEIKIEKTEDELGILLTLSVNKDDMWVVIWKQWNTVSSIRSLLKIIWMKQWKRINLKVLN